MTRLLRGIAGAPGIAIGTVAYVRTIADPISALAAPTGDALRRFQAAQERVAEQLQTLGGELRAEGKEAEAAIFDAQSLLAADRALALEVERLVQREGYTLNDAVRKATEMFGALLSSLEDPYLSERASDVQMVGEQIVAVLGGESSEISVPPGSIVVASDLTPTQTASLRKQQIAGIATARGTATSHVAILARGLGLPAVVGLGDDLLHVPDGARAVLSADEGLLIVEPDTRVVKSYETRRQAQRMVEQRRRALINVPALTSDGHRVSLWANIGRPGEARQALNLGAEGIGLFRTEFLFLERSSPPTEEEQRAAYAQVLRVMEGRPVTIRTLDVGGDKGIPYLPQIQEANPFLGIRGIRFSMRFSELFQIQLRALLRAAPLGDLRLMLPMVTTPEDIAWARSQIDAALVSLAREGLEHRDNVRLGIMVETPAAAVTLDLLAQGISFCSIGGNDLSQYTLAADRGDGTLVSRYRYNDPAVFRLVGIATRDAWRMGLEMSFCGELAADPEASVALVGLGIEKLSMAPTALTVVKEALRSVSLNDARSRAALATGRGMPER